MAYTTRPTYAREATITRLEYLASKFQITDKGCWEWQGRKEFGYSSFSSKGSVRGHRFFYELLRGDLPKNLVIDHLCENKACVNPKHLEPVTHYRNTLRAKTSLANINRYKTHCPQGHLYSEENTYIYKKDGQRQCKECNRGYARRYIRAKRARLKVANEQP